MDVAYDHIQEEALSPEEQERQSSTRGRAQSDLNTEFRDTYKAVSESTWGAKLGGLWGTVKKQGESYYAEARQELTAAYQEASKGSGELVNPHNPQALPLGDDKARDTEDREDQAKASKTAVPESLPADIVKEAESMLSQFRVGAASRLKQVQKAEDAADEALLKFGSNLRNFFREAVTITAPEGGTDSKGEVLFESKDSDGRRIVHATRFDAQLHVIHTTLTSFTQDPASDEYTSWKKDFDVAKKTDDIAADLKKYEELRRSMEKLVPEQVEYVEFWTRYYFLRHVIESEEQKRRELLQNTQADDEEVGWGDDDEEDQAPTPYNGTSQAPPNEKAEELKAISHKPKDDKNLLKPSESRRSNEHSVADSDASYDMISGANSRGPGSPKDEKESEKKRTSTVAEQSDEEDWE